MWERKWLPGEADLTLSVAGKPPVAMESTKFNQAADFKKACHYFCVPNNILKRECPAWSTSGPCGNPHYYTWNPPKTTQLGQSTTWSTSTLIVKMSKNFSLFFVLEYILSPQITWNLTDNLGYGSRHHLRSPMKLFLPVLVSGLGNLCCVWCCYTQDVPQSKHTGNG